MPIGTLTCTRSSKGGIRTHNGAINNRELYLLSYLGIEIGVGRVELPLCVPETQVLPLHHTPVGSSQEHRWLDVFGKQPLRISGNCYGDTSDAPDWGSLAAAGGRN